MKKLILFSILYTLFLSSCSECNDIDTSEVKLKLDIVQLEKQIRGIKTEGEAKQFLMSNKEFSENVFRYGEDPMNDKFLEGMYLSIATDTNFNILWQEYDKNFSDIEPLKAKLEEAFKHVKYYYEDFKLPQFYTYVTGLQPGYEFLLSRDNAVIGLDCFNGKSSSLIPQGPDYPSYITRFYDVDHLVPMIIFNFSKDYNMMDTLDPRDPMTRFKREEVTLLHNMIAYGKAHYFTKQMMPCVQDSIILQYTPKEMDVLKKNATLLWSHFLQNELLFKTDRIASTKYIDPRPFTNEVNAECPGKLGQYFGYEIVKEYMNKNPKVTFQELMKETDTQKIFRQSKYKPQVE